MAGKLKVLIVDDEPSVVHALGVLLDVHEVPWVAAATPDQALDRLDTDSVGVVIQDMNFGPDKTSGEQGIALFRRIRAAHPELPVLLMTAWAALETAVQLVKEGASDYLAKPWDDDKLMVGISNLLRLRALQLENARLHGERRVAREKLAARHRLCGLVYAGDEMHRLVSLAVNVADSDAPVMITGPSGAGKEKLAEIVQANSRRRDKPFLRVNVGALPSELLEAELFGAEAGAYTGAVGRRVGRFEAADGGTLFLDEIDALPLAGQVKLLRVVQSGEFQRLGSNETLHADVRIVSATNSDLAAAVAAGSFREDLYYRLNVIELSIPPLALRIDDILPLAHLFIEQSSTGGEPARLDEKAREALLRHRWDGNVRELQNRIQRALLTCSGGVIRVGDLDLEPSASSADPPRAGRRSRMAGTDPERIKVERALLDADGVVAHAADRLGLSRQALYRKMEKLGIVIERRPR